MAVGQVQESTAKEKPVRGRDAFDIVAQARNQRGRCLRLDVDKREEADRYSGTILSDPAATHTAKWKAGETPRSG